MRAAIVSLKRTTKNPLIVPREALGLSRNDLAARAYVGYDAIANVELGYANAIPTPILAILTPFMPQIGTTPEQLQAEYKEWRAGLGADAIRRAERYLQAKPIQPGLKANPLDEDAIDTILSISHPTVEKHR